MGASCQAARSSETYRAQSMDGNKCRTPHRHPARVARSGPARHGAPKAAMRADRGVIAGVAGGVVRCDAGAKACRVGSAGARWRYGQETRQYQLQADCVRTQYSDRSTPPGRREAQARNWHSSSPGPRYHPTGRSSIVKPGSRHFIAAVHSSQRSIRPRALPKSQTEIINPS